MKPEDQKDSVNIEELTSTKLLAYDLWIEGYRCTGNEAKASFLGTYKAKTFSDACQAWASETGSTTFDATTNKDWGMSIYDNEEDARRFLG